MTHSRPARPRQSRSSYNGRFSSNDSDKRMNNSSHGLPEQKLREIAQKKSLSSRQTDDYIKFMQLRFPAESNEDYSQEWAGRFRNRSEWANGDYESRQALIKINRLKYGTSGSRQGADLDNPNATSSPDS